MISLENFNQTSFKQPIINSPRSVRSLRDHGMVPEDLIQISIKQLKERNPELKLDRFGWQTLWDHYENKRQQKLNLALQQRQYYIKNGYDEEYMTDSKIQEQQQMTAVKEELKSLEKIKWRQQKEIENMLEHERKMQEIREKNEQKQKLQMDKQLRREYEIQEKRNQQEYQRQLREEEKQRKLQQEEYNQKQLAQEHYRREKELAEIEKDRARQLRMEALRREEERKMKQQEFQQQTLQIQQQHEQEMQRKREIMAQKEQERVQTLEWQRQQRIMASQQAQMQLNEKIQNARARQEQELENMKMQFDEKQQRIEYRRREFEEQKRQQMEEQQIQAMKHQEKIKQVIDKNQYQEEMRKSEYFNKLDAAQQRKQIIEEQKERELFEKRYKQYEKEMQRQQVRQNNDQQLEQKTQDYRKKFIEKEQIVQERQQERQHFYEQLKLQEILKTQDKRDAMERLMRKQEWEREQLRQKINEKLRRVDKLQFEKSQILEQRIVMKKEIDQQKQQILEKVDLVKQGKLNPLALSGDGNDSHRQSKQSYQVSQSQQKRPQTAKAYKNNLASKQQDRGLARPKSQQNARINKQQETLDVYGDRKKQQLIQDVKVRQNAEMIRILEEEQELEQERERTLFEVESHEEQIRLEKIFQVERNKAKQRIENLKQQSIQNNYFLKDNMNKKLNKSYMNNEYKINFSDKLQIDNNYSCMQTEAQRFKELGNEQFKQGQYKEAIDSYTSAIREDPSESIYFSNRARSFIKINQFQKAYEDALQSVELNDKNIKAHLLVGESLCYIAREQNQLQKIDQAIQRLTKALTLCTGQDKKTFEPDIKDRICKAKKLQWYLKQDEEIKENKQNYDQLKAVVQSDQGLSQEEKQITLQQMDKYMLLKPTRLQIPEYFCCQISKQLLIDPLTTQSGYSYERRELEKSLQINPGKDPKTLQAIDTKIIYENFNLKQACDEFLQQNPWAYQYQENEDYKQLQF